jgi:signal recognition particle GTPase
MYYYPFAKNIKDVIFKPKEFTKNEIEKILKKFKINKTNEYQRKRYYFRDLIKTKIKDDVKYNKIRKYITKIKDGIIVTEVIKDLEKEQFPNLKNYHCEEIYNFTVHECEKYNIIIKENNNICYLCFEITNDKLVNLIENVLLS